MKFKTVLLSAVFILFAAGLITDFSVFSAQGPCSLCGNSVGSYSRCDGKPATGEGEPSGNCISVTAITDTVPYTGEVVNCVITTFFNCEPQKVSGCPLGSGCSSGT